MKAYAYAPRRDYRSVETNRIESMEPLPMHDPEYWSVFFYTCGVAEWVADFCDEADANWFCGLKNEQLDKSPTEIRFETQSYHGAVWAEGDTHRGYFEHVVYGDSFGGGLWFDGKELTDYDGTPCLPMQVIRALRELGFTVEDYFE